MHAHDFPNASVYTGGLPYARRYPRAVAAATHSLHMPSHIYDRLGRWREAAEANNASVADADAFANSGALAQGGDGPASGGPISVGGGFGFSFNAANMYHSLEYEQYELLQGCRLRPARHRVARMAYATGQLVGAGRAWSSLPSPSASGPDDFADFVGAAWYNATTQLQWYSAMTARQAVWSLMSEWLGAADAQSTVDWRGLITSVPPLPLSWQGATVFSHSFYSPLADAALHNAIALASLYELLSERRPERPSVVALRQLARGGYIRGVCSSEDGCLAERVARCLDVISRARSHYEAAGQAHEENGVAALELQVRSLMALAVGNTSTALELLGRATVLEADAADLQIPSSVTLFFAPSSALEGLTNLMLSSSRELEPSARAAHARAGAAAFEQCLAPTMHPRMPLCRLGHARALAIAGDAEEATASYQLLLLEGEWDHADGACAAGLEEATTYVLRANATALGAKFSAEDEASTEVPRANQTKQPVQPRTLRLGYLASSYYPDGTLANWGRDGRLAVELAVKQLNEAARVAAPCLPSAASSSSSTPDTAPLRLELVSITETNGSTAGLSESLAAMVREGVDAVLGADWSRVAVEAAAFLAPYSVALVSAGATSAELDLAPNVFRTIYSDSRAAALLVDVVRQRAALTSPPRTAHAPEPPMPRMPRMPDTAPPMPRMPPIAILASEDSFGLSGMRVIEASARAHHIPILTIQTFASTDPSTGALIGDGCASNASNVAVVALAVEAVRASGARTIIVSATGPSTECVFAAAAALGMGRSGNDGGDDVLRGRGRHDRALHDDHDHGHGHQQYDRALHDDHDHGHGHQQYGRSHGHHEVEDGEHGHGRGDGAAEYTWLATEEVHPVGGWHSAWGRQVARTATGYVTYLGSPVRASASMRDFERDFERAYGFAPTSSWAAYSYDAVKLVHDASARASSPSRFSDSSPARSLVAELRAADVDGVTGPLSYPEDASSPPAARIGVLQLNVNSQLSGSTLAFDIVGSTDAESGALNLYLAPFAAAIKLPGGSASCSANEDLQQLVILAVAGGVVLGVGAALMGGYAYAKWSKPIKGGALLLNHADADDMHMSATHTTPYIAM